MMLLQTRGPHVAQCVQGHGVWPDACPCASARALSRESALGGQSQMQHTAQCAALVHGAAG